MLEERRSTNKAMAQLQTFTEHNQWKTWPWSTAWQGEEFDGHVPSSRGRQWKGRCFNGEACSWRNERRLRARCVALTNQQTPRILSKVISFTSVEGLLREHESMEYNNRSLGFTNTHWNIQLLHKGGSILYEHKGLQYATLLTLIFNETWIYKGYEGTPHNTSFKANDKQ